jgi:octaheme c-type cytochrome (tetrathionate reductase family)
VQVEGREEPITVGKKNAINNFCIGIRGNWASCTACHAGYGWEDADFDFENKTNIDCLVCHDNSGTYRKGKAGLPLDGVDLMAAAKSVAVPTRENCGGCHFRGGGGNAVKHGDLDESLYYPTEGIDVHMGRYNFLCVDCHQTEDHVIGGRATSVSLDNKNQIACSDCHNPKLHSDERINAHTDTLACQTCHVPEIAVEQATKTYWDWSKAGDPTREEDTHHYLKIKGEFVYEKGLRPEYRWSNGLADRYLMGDQINAGGTTALNEPRGSIRDPNAKIWPFKIHRAKQPYDTEFNYLLQPVTSGEGGFWNEFDWDKAFRLGEGVSGLDYSGNYGFAETEMYWPSTHMVATKDKALQCQACHSEGGRMDWLSLGYDGDPIKQGSLTRKRTEDKKEGADHE